MGDLPVAIANELVETLMRDLLGQVQLLTRISQV